MIGKPRQTDDPVRCLDCGEQYRDHDIILRHAGRTVEGDFWNSECPVCGADNAMQEEYAEMTDGEFRAKQHEVARQRRQSIREQRRQREREADADRADRRAELLDLPDELRGEVRSFDDGEMETEGFVRRIRSIANELERHADAIEARCEQAGTEDGDTA
jgi:uncharacterized Zn finger protein (UPF0148 family)